MHATNTTNCILLDLIVIVRYDEYYIVLLYFLVMWKISMLRLPDCNAFWTAG
jgi:hypothetical protein